MKYNQAQTAYVSHQIAATGQSVTALHLSLLGTLIPRLAENPSLLEEYKKAPEDVALREVGFVAPDGMHLHYVNDKNEYFPPEGDAVTQLGQGGTSWSRVEYRIGGSVSHAGTDGVDGNDHKIGIDPTVASICLLLCGGCSSQTAL